MNWTEGSELTWLIRDPTLQIPVRIAILESGLAVFDRALHFDHPAPPFNRLFLFRRGGCRLRFGKHEHRLVAGRMYVLPASLSFEVDYRARSEFRFFHVQVHDIAGLDIFRDAAGILEIPDASPLARELERTFPGDGALRLRWQSALLQAFSRVAAPFIQRLHAQHHDAARFAELLDYIRQHCNATLTVGDLAQRERRPRSALSKSFQRSFGISLKQHLQAVLLQRAKERLAGSNAKIVEIALDLGFADTYYFFRFFKRHTAQTPLEFRRGVAMPNS